MAQVKIILNEQLANIIEHQDEQVEIIFEMVKPRPTAWVSVTSERMHSNIKIPAHTIIYVMYRAEKKLDLFTETGQKYTKKTGLQAFLAELTAVGFNELVKVHECHALHLTATQVIAYIPQLRAIQIQIKEAKYEVPVGKNKDYVAHAQNFVPI